MRRIRRFLRSAWDGIRCGFENHDPSVTFEQPRWMGYYWDNFEYTCCRRCGKILREFHCGWNV
jgi:hypothetical protein